MSRVRSIVEPFALSYPHVPKMIELEPTTEGVHGGVSIADSNAAGGLQIFMLAYLGQARNDKLRLILNGDKQPGTIIVAPGEENEDTALWLGAELLQKGSNRIEIEVERTSGNNDVTKELVLLYRTSPPGDTPAVLNFSVSHSRIDAKDADDVSVTVTYKNINWYDYIYVDCNGARVTYRLMPDTLPPPATVPKEIMIPIPRSKLEQGGNDSDFELKFRVVDHVSNPSGPPTWSDIVTVDVDLTRTSSPLVIDQSLMTLDGVKLMQDYGWATKEVVGNVQVREASGGVPPYRYTSSDDLIAKVTSNGKVEGLRNGTATLSVTDSAGTTLRYSVQVSNVYNVRAATRLMTVPEAVNWIRSEAGEAYDNFFVPPTVKAIPLNFVDLHKILLPIPNSIPNGFFRWFGRGEGTAGSYAVFNSGTGAFYQGMSTSETRMAPIAFIKT